MNQLSQHVKDFKELSISKLKPAAYNPRDISKKQIEGLISAIDMHGFLEPIVVNKDMTVISGHQRLKAAKELNYKAVPALVLDVDKDTEKELNILMNNPHIQGQFNDEKLQPLLQELKISMGNAYMEFNYDELEFKPPEEPKEIDPEITYRVYIDCDNEEKQQKIFQDLISYGYQPQVVQL